MEPGTGKMYVKKDGTVLTFDTNKCFKNMVELGRVPRNTEWTRAAATLKATTMAASTKTEKPAEPTTKKAKAKKAPAKKAETPAPAEEKQE